MAAKRKREEVDTQEPRKQRATRSATAAKTASKIPTHQKPTATKSTRPNNSNIRVNTRKPKSLSGERANKNGPEERRLQEEIEDLRVENKELHKLIAQYKQKTWTVIDSDIQRVGERLQRAVIQFSYDFLIREDVESIKTSLLMQFQSTAKLSNYLHKEFFGPRKWRYGFTVDQNDALRDIEKTVAECPDISTIDGREWKRLTCHFGRTSDGKAGPVRDYIVNGSCHRIFGLIKRLIPDQDPTAVEGPEDSPSEEEVKERFKNAKDRLRKICEAFYDFVLDITQSEDEILWLQQGHEKPETAHLRILADGGYTDFEHSAGDWKCVFAPLVKLVGERKNEYCYLVDGYAILGSFEDGMRYDG